MKLDFLADHLGLVGVALIFTVGYWQVKRRANRAAAARKTFEKAVQTQSDEPLTLHPEVDPMLCAGCGACSKVCPEGDILQLIDHKAVLVSPTKCVGHGECEKACPTQAITLVFGTKKRGMDIPRISTHYETNVPGLYVVGELGGMGLIRNAVKQGALAAQHALANLGPPSPGVFDLLVVGAGPAGLATCLAAIAGKRSYLCIEQGGFGGTVYQFPRQKVVMTHPAQLPLVGTMKFAKNRVSKEELLGYWNSVRAKTGLKIQENTRFETVVRDGADFLVRTNRGEYRARKVILAMGVRGSPRKLGLPNEELPKVTYNLLEPEQYRRQDVAVVGGGNAGLEAVQHLANPALENRVHLIVRGESFDRANDENKNLVLGLEKSGRVTIHYSSTTREITPDRITIESAAKGRVELPNDYLFIFAGAESPHKFLMGLGIDIERKFGEALR